MKKFCYTISLLLLITFSALSVSARTYTASPYRNIISNYDEAYTAIYEAVSEGENSVDLTELKINSSDIIKIFSDIIQSCPEFFYLDKQIKYYYTDKGILHYVTTVEFSYTMTKTERENSVREYENELSYIVSLIDSGLSDAEKALWVHDYFISSFEYDTNEGIYDAYSFFRERKGVCQAYSLAYMAVLREVGIESFMITSSEMNHAWNLVRIDGQWYHADLVFDDPSPDRTGRVLHENFLLTDEEIANTQNPHYGWTSKFICDSDKYSGGFWTNVTSRMVYSGKYWYYIDSESSSLISRTFADGENIRDIYDFNDKWYVSGSENRYWMGIFSGVSDFLDYIFVNTPYEIIAYSTKTGSTSVYYEINESESGRLFGSNIYKNGLEYLLTDSPDAENREVERFEIKDFTLMSSEKIFPFRDVSKLEDSYAAIKYVYYHGLFNGVSSDRFAPKSTLTRAMFVTVLGRLCNIDTGLYSGVSYIDVKSGLWYSPYIEWASREGIVNGVGGNKFDPTGVITHEQMYKIVAYCGALFGLEASESNMHEIKYSDIDTVSGWAVDGINYCVQNRLIPEGDGEIELRPSEPSTREEAAVLIYRFAKLMSAA